MATTLKVATTLKAAKVANCQETPYTLDNKYVECEDKKDVEGFDTTEATILDTKEVEEVLDTKETNNSKEKTCLSM